MNTRNWAEAIGLIGVIISLALVASQLYQANSVARFTVGTEIMRHYNEINLQVASDPDLAELLVVMSDEQAVLSKAQRHQAISLAYWLGNCWGNAELAYREGWIDRDAFQSTLNDVPDWIEEAPGLKPILRQVFKNKSANRSITEVEKLVLEITEEISLTPGPSQ